MVLLHSEQLASECLSHVQHRELTEIGLPLQLWHAACGDELNQVQEEWRRLVQVRQKRHLHQEHNQKVKVQEILLHTVV